MQTLKILTVLAICLAVVWGCGAAANSAVEQPATLPPAAGSAPVAAPAAPAAKVVEGKYADVNGLKIYYEIHGEGRPLVVLHGAFGWAIPYPQLAKNRQLILVELQGHGHTADIDRPLTIEQMADDVAALLKHLKIGQADLFGYSMGGNVALGVAIRHPDLIRKVVLTGSSAGKMEDAFEPASFEQFKSLPADFAPQMLKSHYDSVAPDASQWPKLVAKIKQMGLNYKGFTHQEMQSVKAPVLIALGDRDGTRPEHAVEMFRQLPNSQLAIFPGADHFLIFQDPDTLLMPVVKFLDAAPPGTRPGTR